MKPWGWTKAHVLLFTNYLQLSLFIAEFDCYLDLAKILPSVEELVKSQEDELDEPELLQVITEGPLEIRELAPIFIIPGLTGYSVLDDLLKSLLYPTFCAVYPSKPWPLEKLAEAYVEVRKYLPIYFLSRSFNAQNIFWFITVTRSKGLLFFIVPKFKRNVPYFVSPPRK